MSFLPQITGDPVALLQTIVYLLLVLSFISLVTLILIIKFLLKGGSMTKQEIVNVVWSVYSLFVGVIRFLNDKGIIANNEYIRILALMTLIMRRPELADRLMVYILQTPNIMK